MAQAAASDQMYQQDGVEGGLGPAKGTTFIVDCQCPSCKWWKSQGDKAFPDEDCFSVLRFGAFLCSLAAARCAGVCIQ